MALEDALVLVESLAGAATVSEAVSAYERRRRRRTDWVLAQTHRRDRARTLPPVLRRMVLRRFGDGHGDVPTVDDDLVQRDEAPLMGADDGERARRR